MSGRVAFFAPETRTVPESRLPPWMTKMSNVSPLAGCGLLQRFFQRATRSRPARSL